MLNYPCFFCVSILQGADGILLGPETLRGMYPIEAIKTVGRICAEVSIYLSCLRCKFKQEIHSGPQNLRIYDNVPCRLKLFVISLFNSRE